MVPVVAPVAAAAVAAVLRPSEGGVSIRKAEWAAKAPPPYSYLIDDRQDKKVSDLSGTRTHLFDETSAVYRRRFSFNWLR